MSLYTAAGALKSLAPWTWMGDDQVFGVKDPESGSVGYCTVMGNLGEHFALGVALGSAGLAGLDGVRGMRKPDVAELLLSQTMLQASFEDRAELEREDLEVTKQLGLKFRGPKAWFLFRSYRPGFLPWFVTGAEARFLAVAIRQTHIVAQTLKEEPDALEPPRPDAYLVRVHEPGGDESAWRDEWLEPSPSLDEAAAAISLPDVPVDPQLADLARDKPKLRSGVWEVDVNPILAPVGGRDERPSIPLQLLVVHHESGVVLEMDMKSLDDYVAGFREHFVQVLDKLGQMPEQLLFANRRTEMVFAPIAAALQIPLERSRKLPGVQQIRRTLARFLEVGPGRQMG